MAQKGLKYEYQFVDLPDNGTKEEVLKILNDLGAEGWWVISMDTQNLEGNNVWGAAWMVRVA